MSKISINHFDALLRDDGPAAIVLKRELKPVEGGGAWIFPPTFAQGESADEEEETGGGNYQIDQLPDDRRNVCLIDSVGSQANRMEPIFKQPRYSALVPQIKVRMKGGDEINLLDVGHRAADAAVRFSKTFGPAIWEAFREYQLKRDCAGILKIAPTSLVFGVWDSRATGAKIQRIVRSVIRAYDVTPSRRSAIYQPAYDYTANQMIDPELDKSSGKNNPLSQEGFKHSPATSTHGGVTVRGKIQQEGVINLVALRVLSSDLVIRRYLLGLSLVALSYRDQTGFNLREGCLLCAATEADFHGNWSVVFFDPAQQDTSTFKDFNHDNAISFAELTVWSDEGLKIIQPESDDFDTETAEKWLKIDKKRRKTLAKTTHPAKAIIEEEAKDAAKKTKRPAPGVVAEGQNVAEDGAADNG